MSEENILIPKSRYDRLTESANKKSKQTIKENKKRPRDEEKEVEKKFESPVKKDSSGFNSDVDSENEGRNYDEIVATSRPFSNVGPPGMNQSLDTSDTSNPMTEIDTGSSSSLDAIDDPSPNKTDKKTPTPLKTGKIGKIKDGKHRVKKLKKIVQKQRKTGPVKGWIVW